MRYHALACDYDGTLALHGVVAPPVVESLHRVRRSGRKLVLVTGRRLPDLLATFAEAAIFDRLVVENGAVVHDPARNDTVRLGPGPSARFVDELRRRRVAPLDVGECIVATWEPHQETVLEAIKDLGLELQVIFNKGAVMVLPSAVNKATGLRAAVHALGLSMRNVVGVGDAQNDHAFLSACECAVAVRNALPAVQDHADWVTAGDHGDGVIELVDRLEADDLAALAPRLARHDVLLGHALDGRELRLPAYGESMLIAGSSAGGKSTFATGVLERLADGGAQFAVIDPEGDYDELPDTSMLGNAERPPDLDETMRLLAKPEEQVVINLIGERLDSRPDAFSAMLARLLTLRTRTGRPHWLLVDEAHHVLPKQRPSNEALVPAELRNVVWITVHPDAVAPAALARVRHVVVVGREPGEALARVAAAMAWTPPDGRDVTLEAHEAWYWRAGESPVRFRTVAPRGERRRHVRKYAEGTLPEDRSFYFRGPGDRLRLRAVNLMQFLELADGVDDETWLHHLRRRDYSGWIRTCIKDESLADEVAAVEAREGSAGGTRDLVRRAVESRYTAG